MYFGFTASSLSSCWKDAKKLKRCSMIRQLIKKQKLSKSTCFVIPWIMCVSILGKWTYQLGEEKGRSMEYLGQKDGWKKERLNLASCCQWLFLGSSPVVLHISHFKDWLSDEVGQIVASDFPLTGSPNCHLIFTYGIIECWSWKGLGNYQCLLFTDVKSLAKKGQVIWPIIRSLSL